MVLLESPHRSINYPTHLTTWEFFFENNGYSPLYNNSNRKIAGYENAATKERLSWVEVKENATKLSTVLVKKYGLQPEDVVSLFSMNTIWYPVCMWAIVRAGGRVNGASPAYNTEEMSYALKTVRSKIIITQANALDVAIAAATAAGILRSHILLIEGHADGFTSIQELIRVGEEYTADIPFRIPKGKTNKDICGYLNFSSGTTGLPKAVMISHHNIISQCLQLQQLQSPGPYSILAVMPLFHITGLVRFCHYPVLMNGDSYMLPSFSMPAMLGAIVKYQVAELILVPPILIRLVRDPIVQEYDLRCVKRWSSGSAPISAEIIELLRQRFPWTGFRQGYGMTESTACITAHPPTHFDYKYATTGGKLVADTVAKVIDLDTGKELGIGETGEILAKGPQIAMGYLNNPSATKEGFDDEGFLHTGDVGHFDREGLIHIEDRIKEMIKVKGLQVPPAELEDLLLGHEDVEDCAVLGIPDAYSGERPKAYVVLKTGLEPSAAIGGKLLDFVKQKKVKYKWLAEIEFTDTIPKSPTGKLLRRVLKVKDKENSNVERRLRVKEDKGQKAKL